MIKEKITPNSKETKFIFFSGKGGVGKTTVSASTAIWLANQGFKTLIISTDLQMSLNDIFKQYIGQNPTQIEGVPNLQAVSIDVGASIEKNKAEIINSMLLIDPESPLLKQIGTDKLSDCGCAQAAVFEFKEYLNSKEYDAVVFDTAPLSSTLEKIGSQSRHVLQLLNQIDVQKSLIEKIGIPGIELRIKQLEDLIKEDENAMENLKSANTSFIMVMIPEAMPFAEVERNIPVLENNYSIPIRGIVINNIIPSGERNKSDFWKSKWGVQTKYIALAEHKFKDKAIGKVMLLNSDAIGVERLINIGNELYGGSKYEYRN